LVSSYYPAIFAGFFGYCLAYPKIIYKIWSNMTRDLRKYASQTNVQLIAGALTLLFVVGLGLIAWIYGFGAALMGLLCMLGALVPIGLIALSLNGLDAIVKRINKD
jgi:Sec-independent protein secretion pathway component TatC